MDEALFLSIRPRFAARILDGSKTVELRRVVPRAGAGTRIVIYESSPTMAIVAISEIRSVIVAPPSVLWENVRANAGVSREEYDAYFRRARRAVGITLSDVDRLRSPIPLVEMRRRWPWLTPPQSYRYVQIAGSSKTSLRLDRVVDASRRDRRTDNSSR